MKVVVLGSGVIGVTSAWYLAKAGHDVTVIDRQPTSAEETSFANAGQISYGYSSPWAAPGIPAKALKWLLQKHAPLKIKPTASPELWSWATEMLANCTEKRYSVNKSRMLRISNYSRECLADLREDAALDFESRQQGTLQLFRKESQMEAADKDIKVLEACGTRYALMDTEGCIAAEPALALVKNKIIGGLRLPDDETGDCYQFTNGLTQRAKALGVNFMFDTEIHALHLRGDEIAAVSTSAGDITADAFVMAMGSYSTSMLRQVGLSVPVYPVKGYSLTVPVTDAAAAPVSTVMDETYKVAITRFDDRIRVAGTAELAGFDHSLAEKRKETIAMVVNDIFPQGGDISQAEYWSGLRPMTPDGTPIIGKTPISNLFTNTGHGTLGWTMACGSGKLLSDIVSGTKTGIDIDGLDISRYGTRSINIRQSRAA